MMSSILWEVSTEERPTILQFTRSQPVQGEKLSTPRDHNRRCALVRYIVTGFPDLA